MASKEGEGGSGVVGRTYFIQPKNNDIIVVDDYLRPINATALTVAQRRAVGASFGW